MKSIKPMMTVALLIVLTVIVMGTVPISMASHSIDHHHHSAQTHTTGICAWMCTAAQTIATDSQVFSPHVSQLDIFEAVQISSIPTSQQFFLPGRAPPI